MDRYINATRLLDKLDADIKMLDNYHTWEASAISYMERTINEIIENGSEFRPVVHAHWIGIDGSYKCSKCGSACIEKADEWIDIQFGCDPVLFCPRCGAVMDEPTENYGYFPVSEDYE